MLILQKAKDWSIKKDLATDKFEIHDNEICLLTNNHYETDFGSPKDWFVLDEGAEIVDVKLENLVDEEERGDCLEGEWCCMCQHPDLIEPIFREN